MNVYHENEADAGKNVKSVLAVLNYITVKCKERKSGIPFIIMRGLIGPSLSSLD